MGDVHEEEWPTMASSVPVASAGGEAWKRQ